MTATSCSSPMTSPPPSRRAASPTTRACARPWGGPASRGRRGSRSSRMSEPGPVSRRGRNSRGRPSPASLGVVRVDADFEDEYPGADRTCTESYASLCRTGEALLGELDRRVRMTFGIPQAAATLAVIDGAAEPLTPSQVSDRVLIASATMTATLDLLEHRGWIRRVANPSDRRSTLIEITPDGKAAADQLLPGIRTLEKSILSALTPGERGQLLDLLAKILARAAEAAAGQPEPLNGQRIRPARLGGLPQSSRPHRTPSHAGLSGSKGQAGPGQAAGEVTGTAPIPALRRIATSDRRYSPPILPDSGSFDSRGPSTE